MVKSQNEINQVRRASRILKKAFNAISDTPLKEMNEKFLEAKLEREARIEGTEDARVLIARPQAQPWAFRPAEQTSISTGDTVIVYLSVEFERYWSEGIKTFVAGADRLLLPELNDTKALYNRILDGMKPGKTSSQFYKEAINQIGKEKAQYIPDYGMGQGIGIDLQELPVLEEKNGRSLKEGMCLTLRLAIKDQKLGAIIIGNILLLTKNSAEVLSS